MRKQIFVVPRTRKPSRPGGIMPRALCVLLLSGILALGAVPAAAQVVRGTVVDNEVTEVVGGVEIHVPVVGAEVELVVEGGGVVRTVTDSSGVFLLSAPGPGTFGLRVRHPAYLEYEARGIGVAQDEDTSVVYGMPREAVERNIIDQVFSPEEIASALCRLGSKEPCPKGAANG